MPLLEQDTIRFLAVLWLTGLVLILSIVNGSLKRSKARKEREALLVQLHQLTENALEVTPEEFFSIRNYRDGGQGYISTQYDGPGVYILYNLDKNMHYVGQSKNMMQRVYQHFTGHGNGDVYADYKYGDQFTIKMINFKHCPYRTLDELERHTIAMYCACSEGYNRTRGNYG